MNTTRRWLTHLSAFFFVLFMAFGLTSYADDGMKVHFLNVGQADSTLITCGDHAMLIDAGKTMTKSRFSITSRTRQDLPIWII